MPLVPVLSETSVCGPWNVVNYVAHLYQRWNCIMRVASYVYFDHR